MVNQSEVSTLMKQKEVIPEEGRKVLRKITEAGSILKNNGIGDIALMNLKDVEAMPVVYKAFVKITSFKKRFQICVRTGGETLSDYPGLYTTLRSFRDSCKGNFKSR